ncbi:Signal recognition particle 19 kDa protein [Plasmodiophora brassicae]|uniref:Signal recognition particle 19 kDa protein n=2 Tax=Plasmodiophora brassicae TaxID=37360 RepID=A0A3P3YC58_PLABS|nr:unnamed protein product [Plasmodiophora brassicae]
MSSSAAPLSLNKSRWNIVYPIYMDSTKQIAEGRKIPLDKAVQKPTLSECVELCRYLKLPFEIEANKCYSRDFFQVGRLRVLLKQDDGSPIRPDIRQRRDLLIMMASLIPKLKSRTEAPSVEAQAAAKKGKKGRKHKK